ncbi:MAG: L-aspartate oxidase [Chloroflexota bacterium]
MLKTDILVIGSGIGGCIAALSAADCGKKVTILTKTKSLLSGNTPYAQGGIIYKGENDSPEQLKRDIMIAGDGHCWEQAVDQLARLGPKLVESILIEKLGVEFDRDIGDRLDLTEEGAHSQPRIIHSKDKTGESIHLKIVRAVAANPNIETLTETTAVDLLTLSHHSTNSLDIYKKPACFGALVLDNPTGRIYPIYAEKTILATGGLGRIYLHTTNPEESTGDGIALAWRAGARCFNLQYIQFHPTAFYNEHDRFLISESMRGEGGRLIDKNGEEFMPRFHEQGSLAPRDIVARAIHTIMLEQGHPCVYLDITHKDPQWLRSRFPTIYERCLEYGIDISSEPIPVVPAAHYSCGGIGVSLRGRTSLQRLYAVGEVSCTGVHGANRLASTSLLEALVWGFIAGKDACKRKEDGAYFPETMPWVEGDENVDPALIQQDWLSIKNTMWNYVGLVRTKQRLHRAQINLRHLQTELEQFYRRAKMTRSVIELRNGVQTAIAVTNATVESPVSRGAHFISD